MARYDIYEKRIVYKFDIGDGGIGDCIKFFLYLLNICIKYHIKLYYLVSDIYLEKYLRLKYDKMYIRKEEITEKRYIKESDIRDIRDDIFNVISPDAFYNSFSYDKVVIPVSDVFMFSEDVKINSYMLTDTVYDYISIHLRLGDKYLETDKQYVQVPNDTREYDEDKIFGVIRENKDKKVMFFCDNNAYKMRIKEMFDNIVITKSDIGHTSLSNTTDKQTLDAVTEFYLLSESKKIYCASISGFSIVASMFRDVRLVYICP